MIRLTNPTYKLQAVLAGAVATTQPVITACFRSTLAIDIVVARSNQVLKDGVVIAETEHRSSYGQGEKDRLLAEVEGAVAYVWLIDWAASYPDPLV